MTIFFRLARNADIAKNKPVNRKIELEIRTILTKP